MMARKGRWDFCCTVARILKCPRSACSQISPRWGRTRFPQSGDLSSDDQSFVVVGVPTLSLSVEPGDYDNQHHTITDTLDKVDPQMLAMDTAVLAVAAYAIANADQGLGRRLTSSEVDDLLKKTGQAEYVELDYGRREK